MSGMRQAFFASLWKDYRKVGRKPAAYCVHAAIALVMTALIGLVFMPSASGNQALGVMQLVVVDEDASLTGQILGGAAGSGEMQDFVEVTFLGRAEAMETLLDNQASAILILPAGFTEQYLLGEAVPPLELIKNPAQRFHPAVLEELLGVVVEGANALYRVAGADLQDWKALLEAEGVPDFYRMAGLMTRLGERFERAGDLLFPPLIQFDVEEPEPEEGQAAGMPLNIFAYILPGFAGLFLFFIADHVIRDLYRESKAGTLQRYRFHQGSLFPFLASKLLVSLLVIEVSLLTQIGIGVVVFDLQLSGLLELLLFSLIYGFFVTGFMLFLNALSGKESRADTINSIVVFSLAFLGGNMVPINQLPDFISGTLTPLLPNSWFIRGFHHVQLGFGEVSLLRDGLLMAVLGVALFLAGSRILHLRLDKRLL